MLDNGWNPAPDHNLLAIRQIRKAVYGLSNLYDFEVIRNIAIDLGLGYIDWSYSDSNKNKIIRLFQICQEQQLLGKLFERIVEHDPQHTLYDVDICQKIDEYLEADIGKLSFDVQENACCCWYKVSEGERIRRFVHTEHYYVIESDPCKRLSHCDICGEKMKDSYKHQWGEWRYESECNCTKIRKCTRCSKGIEKEYDRHDWIESKKSNGSSYKICQHCHKEVFEISGRWTGTVVWGNGVQDYWDVTIEHGGFLWMSLKAVICVYGDVHDTEDGRMCKYKVVQKGDVDLIGRKCAITGSKIKAKPQDLNYSLDSFSGKIEGKCDSIVGIVTSGHDKGELKLIPYDESN
mgnify:CR=1 FL=1